MREQRLLILALSLAVTGCSFPDMENTRAKQSSAPETGIADELDQLEARERKLKKATEAIVLRRWFYFPVSEKDIYATGPMEGSLTNGSTLGYFRSQEEAEKFARDNVSSAVREWRVFTLVEVSRVKMSTETVVQPTMAGAQ